LPRAIRPPEEEEHLARRFAHIPCLGLRGLLHDGPDGSIEAFLSGLEPEFAEELRAALNGAAAAETRAATASGDEPGAALGRSGREAR
jgi:acylphosphatase